MKRNSMKQDVYAHYKPKHWTLRWFYRLFGLLLVWTSVTMPESVQLIDTPLVEKLQSEYPTWYTVLKDIVYSILILGGISILLNLFLKYARQHHFSKKLTATINRLDNSAFSRLLGFLFFITRWLMGIAVSLLLWYTIMKVLPLMSSNTFRLPVYTAQPVIFVMGVLGLTLLIESVDMWQKKMRRYFHLRYRY